ncbi:Invasion protein IalB, involved in pathogenesis [Monaibacterium marinum]|uniref:Invasion protein IalB, involved in pathogenesis n=1 Tax=Pontivivens marinum TaxID=1690039 RepID=A0A2C9CU54_9RHOB|nr:invasion associated locus B family protein [Monaibacterium marinum]SOH94854.1 Invasion protein IalB, involved in pathogenesis [Monaibacterium marinum]
MIRLLALLLLVGPAAAEEVARHRDWSLDCRAVAQGETSCVLAQRLVAPGDDAEIAQIVLRRNAGGTALVLRVPTGVNLTQNAAYRVDGGAGMPLRWTACDAQYCLAVAPLSDGQLDGLRGGITATFGYQPLAADQAVLFDASLLGISAGLAALD